MRGDKRLGVSIEMIGFRQYNRLLQNNFMNRKREGRSRERMGRIFEGQLVVIRIVCHIGFVMHYQKIPKRNVAYLLFVLTIVLQQNRQAQHLVKLRV